MKEQQAFKNKDVATNDELSIHTMEHEKETITAKRDCEISIQQAATSQSEQYSLIGNPEIPASMREKGNDEVIIGNEDTSNASVTNIAKHKKH